ncbi:MAG: MltA domain-containing protein [Gomphosphaeria aponina SAG 52.96 = DSM 107014]|uniref:peptidoglycan lytic exotransglycosylase n=1 Tax=Gomphosphaeria aponina SAG 52.96 = DSM 107014 TaxID=1521640 RepID=A0A941GN76_9CHRO|nr:MltA domain-containing protein [Gomphosphaeria aponina SAG 52.96 = DSM 107014]
MKQKKTWLLLALGLILMPHKLWAGEMPLREVEKTQSCLANLVDEQLSENVGEREKLLEAINYSLAYLQSNSAAEDYEGLGIKRDRVERSLLRFQELLLSKPTQIEFQAALEQEFVCYQSLGKDGQGTVLFTGYFEPVYRASRRQTAEYAYPLYRKPADFDSWGKPHPTRLELEGEDGLARDSILSGYELVWLGDRLEAFLIQVQGSAKLELTDGTIMTVGYDGSTDYPYLSIGGELVKDGKFKLEEISLPVLIDYFQAHPGELDEYLPRNNRFIFFRDTQGAPPRGSLGVPVTSDRSIATDKTLMPPGGLALIKTTIPSVNGLGEIEMVQVSQYVLDQDTGSGIKGAGRVDIFMGSGEVAGERAGVMNATGELYYLLLNN